MPSLETRYKKCNNPKIQLLVPDRQPALPLHLIQLADLIIDPTPVRVGALVDNEHRHDRETEQQTKLTGNK